MRLIDADALGMDMWIQMGVLYGEDIGKAFADIVRNAPTIDAEPVVRCKDCEHYNPEANVAYIAYCPMEDGEHLKPTDYCSFGERREK